MKVCSLEEPSVWLANGYPSVVRQATDELQWGVHFCSGHSEVAQRKRVGLITQRSVDRNHPSLLLPLTKYIPGGIRTLGLLLRKQTPYHWATGTPLLK